MNRFNCKEFKAGDIVILLNLDSSNIPGPENPGINHYMLKLIGEKAIIENDSSFWKNCFFLKFFNTRTKRRFLFHKSWLKKT